MATKSNTDPFANRPADRLKVTYGDAEHEIFMSAGLLRRLTGLAQCFGDPFAVLHDANVQSVLLTEALTPRSVQGEAREKVSLEDYDISMDEADKLLTFITGHMLYFFASATSRVKELQKDPTLKAMVASTQSATGTQDSKEMKQ